MKRFQEVASTAFLFAMGLLLTALFLAMVVGIWKEILK